MVLKEARITGIAGGIIRNTGVIPFDLMLEGSYCYPSLNVCNNAEKGKMELITLRVHISDRPITDDSLEIGEGPHLHR